MESGAVFPHFETNAEFAEVSLAKGIDGRAYITVLSPKRNLRRPHGQAIEDCVCGKNRESVAACQGSCRGSAEVRSGYRTGRCFSNMKPEYVTMAESVLPGPFI